jgi:hypothetical protein
MFEFLKPKGPRQLSLFDVPLALKLRSIMMDPKLDDDTKSQKLIEVIEPNKELLFVTSKLLPGGGSIMHMFAYGEPRINSQGEKVPGCLVIDPKFEGILTKLTRFLENSPRLKEYLTGFKNEFNTSIDDDGMSVLASAWKCQNTPALRIIFDIFGQDDLPKFIEKNKEFVLSFNEEGDPMFVPLIKGAGKKSRRKTIRRKVTRKRK